MDLFRKVKAGDKARNSPAKSAGWLNIVSRSAEYFQKQIEGGEAGGGGIGLKNSSGLVKVKNLVDDGDPVDLIRGNYVQLGDYLLDDIDHRYQWYEGNLYDKDKKKRIAVLTTAIPGTEIGEARILGKCSARVDVSDITHRFAKPDDGEYLLISATSGPVEILSDMDSTGEQEVTVLLGGGGGATNNFTKFAKVTDDGGYAVLLDEDFAPTVTMTPGDELDDEKIEFESAHEFITIGAGRRVMLSAGLAIEPGSRLTEDHTLSTGQVVSKNRVRALLTDPPLTDVQILGDSFEFQKKLIDATHENEWETYHTGKECES